MRKERAPAAYDLSEVMQNIFSHPSECLWNIHNRHHNFEFVLLS